MRSSVSLLFCATKADSSLSCTCMSATCCCASSSLSSPSDRLPFSFASMPRFLSSSSLYSAINSRYDLGVVYTSRLSMARYSSAATPTDSCTKAMCSPMLARIASVSISTTPRKRAATEINACCGQLKNQLIAVHDVSAGNLRQRLRNLSPTGDMQMHRWRRVRTSLMKNSKSGSRASITPACFPLLRTPLMIVSLSSSGNRPGG
mmetsp:Transcript_33640/g.92176  ORF Transcript_33640/g.92176 Transcript_33640/m.92176 type:complete len:205 (-) Transcript_33640:714-1328(-)